MPRLACLPPVLLLLLAACAPSPGLRAPPVERPVPATPAAAAAPDRAADVREEGALRFDGIPERDPTVTESLRPYAAIRPSNFFGWLPGDRGILIGTRFGNTQQLHVVSMPEGMRRQITFFDEPIAAATVSPSPEINGAIFAKDDGGDENFQLYFIDFERNDVRPLTRDRARNERVVIARDGHTYAYASSRRSGADFDIWVASLIGTEPPRLLLAQGGAWYPLDFSPDGKSLLVQRYESVLKSELYLVDVADGRFRKLLPNQPESSNPAARFAPDGSGVYFVSDAGETGFLTLYFHDFETRHSTPVGPQTFWDVSEFDLSPDGRYLVINHNTNGSSLLRVFDRSQEDREISKFSVEPGVVGQVQINRYGTEVGFRLSSAQYVGDVISLAFAVKQLTRWTRGETGGILPDGFVVPRTIQYATFDNYGNTPVPVQIPAHVYDPRGAGPHPVLILIHGGPEAQARPQFSDWIQYLVRELKMAVIVPNVRGSSGYGRAFLAADDGFKREDAVKDIGALLDWIATQPQFDARRVVVMGGSYGGYMVLASLARFGDRLAAGIDIVGISHFVTFLENTHPYRRDQRRVEYGDERDPEMRAFLERISPLNQVDRMRRPLLVIHGANDPRVPQREAEQIVAALRGRGVPVWYLLARDEGHGFRKQSNQRRMDEVVVQFLRHFVLDERGS